MAFIKTEIHSSLIGRTLPLELYFPTDLPAQAGNEVKGVITLLHGYSGGPSNWTTLTAAPRYAADNGYVLVCPSGDNSLYHDMAFGGAFYTHLTAELPALLHKIFKLPAEREKNFIAGLSMGGYGALRIALSHPERYAACGSFSGVVDFKGMAKGLQGPTSPQHAFLKSLVEPVFGPVYSLPESSDLFALIKSTAALSKEQQPRIYCSCGRQDDKDDYSILAQNRALHEFAAPLPLDYVYHEWDGGHEWSFWDRSLAEFIGFIQNSDYAEAKRRNWQAPAD